MLKNNSRKLNKVLFGTFVLCLLMLFSATIMLQNKSTVLADVHTVDINRTFVANDYIFEEELNQDIDFAINGDTALPDVGDIDVSTRNYYCLRDDYVIYTQDQQANGFCWAFASSMALGTTMMVSTGQFYDFSEAWIGLARMKDVSSYVYGDGGNASYFNNVFSKHGLVLESDFTYDNSYLVNREDYSEYYDYYSQYADKTLYENIDTISYSNSNQVQIKNHIYNHGALSISMFWNTGKGMSGVVRSNDGYSYKYPSAKDAQTGGHAITLIGWDDQISATIGGKSYKGAWICLNSWGEDVVGDDDGILYVFYDDTDLYGTVYGYKYNPTTTGLYFNNNIKSGTGYTSYQTNLKGKYYTGYNATTNTTKQQNIYFDNDINITYEYNISSDSEIKSINVFHGLEDVTVDFDITIDETNKEYTLNAQDVKRGAYKILIEYSNGTITKEYINTIYVNTDAEASNVYIDYYSYSSGISNNGLYFVFSSYNYSEITINLATTKTSGSFSVRYTGTSYNALKNSSFNIYFSGINASNNLYTQTKQIVGTNDSINVTINVMFSENTATNKLVNIYYGLNGGVNTAENLQREIFNTTEGLILKEPTRRGFNFVGWYYDSNFTKPVTLNKFSFENVIQIGSNPTCYANTPNNKYYTNYLNNSNIAFVYAKWELKEPTGATLKSTAESLAFAQSYVLSVDSIAHELGKMMILESIDWYLGGQKISTTIKNELSQVASEYGKFTYYAIIKLRYREQTIYVTSSELSVMVLDSISDITYSNGTFSWPTVNSAIKYTISLFLINSTLAQPSLTTQSTQVDTNYKLLDKVSCEGNYYIVVVAILLVDGEEYPSAEITSNPVSIYEVKYITNNADMHSLFVDSHTEVNNQAPQTRPGYVFNYWCTDVEKQLQFNEGSLINESITLYANWSIKDIEWTLNTSEIRKYYDGQESDILVTATHESGATEFVYKWYMSNDLSGQNLTILDVKTNTLKVKEVLDSAHYYCEISLTDKDGLFTMINSDYVLVEILKAQTQIDTNNILKTYEYTGVAQVVNSGAKLLDSQENLISGVEFTYTLYGDDGQEMGNSFINVPLGGKYKLKVTTNGIDNYAGAIAYLYIDVAKARSEIIVAKKWQTFRYTGRPVEPTYQIGNTEQTIDSQSFPINFGEYDITLVAPETQNYERITEQLHISIAKANIKVKANDVTSILFFGQKELSYTIEGEVFEGDNLNLQLHADIDTGKIGSYDITVTSDNENYYIALEHGTYTVTAWPYYLVILFIVFIIYVIIKLLAKRRYQYDFETNGGNIVSPIDTKNKKDLSLDIPTKEGYQFVGWYSDIELTKPFTNRFAKSKGKTLYAKWQKVNDNKVLTQEEISVQQIVDEIDEKLNPKQIIEEQELPEREEIIETKEPTEQEKMQEIIGSVDTKLFDMSNEEMEEFIKNISDINKK